MIYKGTYFIVNNCLFGFQSEGNDRLSFLCEVDIKIQIPSSWMAALDLLRENYANSLIITTFAEIIKKDVKIVTVHGVIILFPLLSLNGRFIPGIIS